MTSAFSEVEALLAAYFEGLYQGDTDILRQVFHPDALYACVTGGSLLSLRMDAYFRLVDERPSPASRHDPRTDRILAIEFVGPVTALARVQCAILPRHFTDLLSLLRVDGRWQVMSKVFHVELQADG
jgi:hypothetical protein